MRIKTVLPMIFLAAMCGWVSQTGKLRQQTYAAVNPKLPTKNAAAGSDPSAITELAALNNAGTPVKGGSSQNSTRAIGGLPGMRPLGDLDVDPRETQQLEAIFAAVSMASATIPTGPEAGAQRRGIESELRTEMESFVTNHLDSGWTPAVRLRLARIGQMRSGYARAIEHYQAVWDAVKGSGDSVGQEMALESSGGLAKLLTLTGRLEEFDVLEAEAKQLAKAGTRGSEWGWAKEMRAWAKKHPTDAYKCGLYSLDQLGRLTQAGQFNPARAHRKP